MVKACTELSGDMPSKPSDLGQPSAVDFAELHVAHSLE